MPVAVSYPGVYIQEVPSGVRTITGVSTSIALFIGWAPKGPTDRAVRIGSFTDFIRIFGDVDRRSNLGYSVGHFFNNGGSDAYVINTFDPDAVAASTTIEKFAVSAKYAGVWGNDLGIKLEPTPSGKRLEVYVRSTVNGKDDYELLETFVGLSDDPANPRYAPNIVNPGSEFIKLTPPKADDEGDEDGGGAPEGGDEETDSGGADADGGGADADGGGADADGGGADADGEESEEEKKPTMLAETKGTDGTIPDPTKADDAFHTTVNALCQKGSIADRIDLFNLICVPGLSERTTLEKLQTFARDRRAFLIADCAEGAKVDDVAKNLPSSSEKDYSAIYFPWVVAPDPLQSQAPRNFPPCGFVAGIMARTDSERGVWKAPAGTDAVINGASSLRIDMSDFQNGVLNKQAVNCLRTFNVYGNVVWGARTLEGNDDSPSDWKYTPIRRLALFIEESLFRGTKWVVFEPNDEPLWAQIRLNVGAFMNSLFKQGAFQGSTPKDAYFVKCDKETNPQNDINRGIVNIVVGFAPLKPAEFVIITIQQMAGQIQT